MFRSLALMAAVLFSLPSHLEAQNGTAELTCTAPTLNEDGTPLTDLTSYDWWYGCTASGSYQTVEVTSADVCANTITGLPESGVCYFAVKAVNSVGVASDFSTEASKVMGILPLSGPITNLSVTWAESTSIYSLPETDFTGTAIVAGNWSLSGQALTIDFEVTPRSYPTRYGRIISKATGAPSQAHLFMVSMRNGALRFRLKTNGVTTTLLGPTQIPLNQLTVGRAVYDGVNMSLFVNGQLDARVPKTGDMDGSSDAVWVGGNPPDNYAPFDGLIAVTVN